MSPHACVAQGRQAFDNRRQEAFARAGAQRVPVARWGYLGAIVIEHCAAAAVNFAGLVKPEAVAAVLFLISINQVLHRRYIGVESSRRAGFLSQSTRKDTSRIQVETTRICWPSHIRFWLE